MTGVQTCALPISVTVNESSSPAAAEAALFDELDRVRREGIDPGELAKAKAQIKARLVFENDSVTNIAHQLGYFETIGGHHWFAELPSRVAAVTLEEVAEAARRVLVDSNRTVGWFEPVTSVHA